MIHVKMSLLSIQSINCYYSMDLSNLQVADFIKSLLIADSFIANLSGLRELRPYRNFAVFTGHEPVETALV